MSLQNQVKDFFGRKAYEAYCASSDNKSLVSGCELPKWNELKEEIKNAWKAAADEVLKQKAECLEILQ